MTDKFPPGELLRMLIDLTVYNRPLKDIQTVLFAGADPNGTLKQGLRPLHYAVFHNRPEVLLLLVRYGAEVNRGDDIGYTPLHIAAKHGFLTCAQLLLEHGAVVNFCDDANSAAVGEDAKVLALLTVHPLNLAIENNHPEMTELLLKNGANPNQKYFIGHEINIVPLENVDCLDVLLRYGADPDAYNRSGITPLMKACKQGHTAAMRVLLNYGADINKTCHPKLDQKRALHFAVSQANTDVMRILLDAGADTRQPDEFRFPPLEFAVTQDKLDICRMLLCYGANPNEVNGNLCVPLQMVCSTPDLVHQRAIIEVLLEAGADPCFCSGQFSYISPCLSPLIEYLTCNSNYDLEIVRSLLQYGAEVNLTRATGRYVIKDKNGVVSQLRKLTNQESILTFLVEASVVRSRQQVRQEGTIPPVIRAYALEACAMPASLKHLCRVYVMRLLKCPRPRHVQLLPLPTYIKDYVLYQTR